jgi:hypothetical protein
MHNIKLITGILIVCICMHSCKKNNDAPITVSEYFPLTVGNFWKLEHTEKLEVTGTKTLNNKLYFVLKWYSDTTCYRVENDKIFVIDHSSNESVKFNLAANVNSTWNYDSYEVTLVSKTDSINIHEHKYYNCYHFYFNAPGVVDEEHSIWLAPGIGLIQESCGECMYPIRKLDTAKIGGQLKIY